MSQQQQYSFPMVSDEDIAAFLRDVNYPFRPEWKRPTQQMANEIFAALVDITMGVTSERLSRPEVATMDRFNIHPDVYHKGLPELGMLMMTFEVMEACCVPQFSIKDLQAPTWGRLRVVFSAVINFIRFQHEFFAAIERDQAHGGELRDSLNKIKDNLLQLTNKYNEYVGSPEARLLKQLEKQQEELEQKYLQKKKQREQAEGECRQAIARLKLITDQVQSCEDTIKGLKYELDLLQSRDITGLLHSVENYRAQVEVHETTLSTQQNDLTILRSKQDLNNNYQRVLNALKIEFEEYHNLSKLHRQAQDRTDALSAQLYNAKHTTQQLTQQKQQLQQECDTLSTEIKTMSIKYQDDLKYKQQQYNTLYDKKQHWETKEMQNLVQIKQYQQQMERIQYEITQKKENHIKLLNQAIIKLNKLQDAVDTYHTRIIDANSKPVDKNAIAQTVAQRDMFSPQITTNQTPNLEQYNNINTNQPQQTHHRQHKSVTPVINGHYAD